MPTQSSTDNESTATRDGAEDRRLSSDVFPEVLRSVREKMPKTARGERTREKILKSAREIFRRDGYAAARITDMTATADVALGTFYSYFDDKKDVLAALLESVFEDLYTAARAPYLDSDDRYTVVRSAIHDYMSVYHENRDLMGTLMEATTVDQGFADLWFEIRSHFITRIVRNIERAQNEGLTEPMHTVLEASALGGMIENFCWIWFSMGGERRHGTPLATGVDFEEMVDILARLWYGALLGTGNEAVR